MKITNSKCIAQLLTAVALAVLGSSAFGASNWDLNALCTSSSTTSIATGSCGTGLTVMGLSTATGTVGATTFGTTFNAATVYDWGPNGLGVVGSNENSGDTGPHAADNKYGTDAFLFNFTTGPVSLSNLKIGWNGTDTPTTTTGVAYDDSDLQVFAWTGAGAPTTTGSSPTSAGWVLIGNYFDVGSITNPVANQQQITSTVYSSSLLSG